MTMPVPTFKTDTDADTIWEWRSRSTGVLRRGPLYLHWKADGDEISESCDPAEMDAPAVWALWIDTLVANDRLETIAGPGWVRLYWFARGLRVGSFPTVPPDVAGDLLATPEMMDTFNTARFVMATHQAFVDHFTWPVDAVTQMPVNWLRLPVPDKYWNADRVSRGGFIQQATGWKPAPLQPFIHIPTMAECAGLYAPRLPTSSKRSKRELRRQLSRLRMLRS